MYEKFGTNEANKERGWAKTSFSHIKNEQFHLGVARFPFHAL